MTEDLFILTSDSGTCVQAADLHRVKRKSPAKKQREFRGAGVREQATHQKCIHWLSTMYWTEAGRNHGPRQ